MANHRRSPGIVLDDVDRMLIDALDRNARAAMSDLARLVGLSPQSTADRVRRLEDLEVIAGFTLRLNPAALGLSIGAYIRIQPALGELQRVAELVAGIPEVVECARITGEDCFIAKVFVPSLENLEGVIDRLAPFARTNTSIIQSATVAQRQPRVPTSL